jgi:hypothetical protein
MMQLALFNSFLIVLDYLFAKVEDGLSKHVNHLKTDCYYSLTALSITNLFQPLNIIAKNF